MNLHQQTFTIETAPATAMFPSRPVMEHMGGISRATLDRWVDAGIIPPPIVINRVRYWQAGQLREALQKMVQHSQPNSQTQAASQEGA